MKSIWLTYKPEIKKNEELVIDRLWLIATTNKHRTAITTWASELNRNQSKKKKKRVKNHNLESAMLKQTP